MPADLRYNRQYTKMASRDSDDSFRIPVLLRRPPPQIARNETLTAYAPPFGEEEDEGETGKSAEELMIYGSATINVDVEAKT